MAEDNEASPLVLAAEQFSGIIKFATAFLTTFTFRSACRHVSLLIAVGMQRRLHSERRRTRRGQVSSLQKEIWIWTGNILERQALVNELTNLSQVLGPADELLPGITPTSANRANIGVRIFSSPKEAPEWILPKLGRKGRPGAERSVLQPSNLLDGEPSGPDVLYLFDESRIKLQTGCDGRKYLAFHGVYQSGIMGRRQVAYAIESRRFFWLRVAASDPKPEFTNSLDDSLFWSGVR